MARRRKKIPKDPVTGTINKLSHEGRGICQIEGKTTFVDFALPNETVTFTYQRCHTRYDEAILHEVIKPSTDRVSPMCDAFMRCGGCRLQHFEHKAQVAFKQQVMLEQLQHIGNVTPDNVLPALSDSARGYRRKARLGVRFVTKKDKVLVGFREVAGRYLADINDCAVLHPSVGEHIQTLESLIASLDAYCEIAQIEVAVADNATALVLRNLKPLSDKDTQLITNFAREKNYWVYLQPGGIETVYRLWPEPSEDKLYYKLPDQQLTLQFEPLDFTQVNIAINRKMINQALDLLNIQKDETVLDLFCGLGNFSLPLAQQCKALVGVEGDDVMVQRAKSNAELNKITNTEFFSANLFEDHRKANWSKQYDVILIDPPRTGAEEIVQNIDQFNAKRILYVSCNPATLARDAAHLIEKGYKMTHAGLMDMFPHTRHMEAMALFCQSCASI